MPSLAEPGPPATTATATSELCAGVLAAAAAPLPPPVARAARRSLLNVLGTSVGAARTAAVEALLRTARDQGADGPNRLPGRAETVDPYWAAIVTGTAAHLDDFDDTHLATVIHPGAAGLATVLALAADPGCTGADHLTAFAVGCEVQLRIGNAISPNHYDRGWHITGTCGVFGATVTAGLLLGLDAPALAHALALAATMTLGHRESFGSMTKPLHPGKAAANGLLAARLAAAGVTGPDDPLGDGGVLTVLADRIDRAELVHDWAADWELEGNAFKPYPCGIVAHPAIDAAVAAAEAVRDPAEITEVRITCHPLVPELMGRRQPSDGLHARFSAYHAAAVGLVDGEVGLLQFGDERAVAPEIVRLRELITLEATPSCPRDAATLRLSFAGRDPVTSVVEHARGSLARPLTDDELRDKVDRLVSPVLGAHALAGIEAAVHGLATAPNLDQLLDSITPSPADPGSPQ
jgi:2-methylcitrate dehydratase PrpD